MDNSASYQFFLHLHENFTWDDGFMAVFHIVLRNNAIVLDPLFGEEVHSVGFLQQCITDILLIAQNLIYVAGVPPFITCFVLIPSAISPLAIFNILAPSRYSR